MSLTADALDEALLRRVFWHSTNAPLTQAERLAIASEELLGDAFPLVMASGGDYYVATKDYTVVANQRRYRLPDRAYGGVKDVRWVDSQGDEFALGAVHAEDVPRTSVLGGVTDPRQCSYYLEGDAVALHPVPTSASGTLRVKYYRKPSTLALTTSSNVVSIGDASWAAGVQSIEISTIAQYVPLTGVLTDIVSSGNAYAALVTDTAVTAGGLGEYTLSVADNPSVAAGDYLCAPGYTPFVQLPNLMHPYFIRRVAGACLTAHGDRQGAAAELQAAAQLYEKSQSTIRPRDRAEPNTIITRNSPLRVRGGGYYRGL